MINPRRAAKRKQRLESEWIWADVCKHSDAFSYNIAELEAAARTLKKKTREA